jgi:transcriptional regulator with XRE-family HTH domain
MRHARAIRLAQGKTQAEVEKALGIEQSRLSRFERGSDLFRYPLLKALAEYYGVGIDTLIVLEEAAR